MTEFTGIALLATIILTVVVLAVAFTDLRERRIPNVIVFPAALIGLALNASRGWQGLWFGGKGLAIGFALVVVLMVSGSLNMTDIVMGQGKGWFADRGLTFLSWNWLPLLPICVVYVVSAVAETNRHPFDVVEGESEIVAGHMVEYSGMGFAIFFLAEYANMILLSALAVVMFFGGWQPPLDLAPFNWLPGFLWLGIKTFFVVSLFVWFRASFPRYRYDQIMRLGWKIFIPVTLVWLVVIAVWMQTPWNIWT